MKNMTKIIITMALMLAASLLIAPVSASDAEQGVDEWQTGVFGHGGWYLMRDDRTLYDWTFGDTGDMPFVLADGRTGVFGKGHWFVRDPATGGVDEVWGFGDTGDIPFVLADGRTGVFGKGHWFVRNQTTGEVDEVWGFGDTGDRPFVLPDGRTGVFGKGHWFVMGPDEDIDDSWAFGQPGDKPFILPDGSTGTFRDGLWEVRNPVTGGVARSWNWGSAGDEPFVLAVYAVDFGVREGEGDIEAGVEADGEEIEPGDKVPRGSKVVFTATPDEGWEIKGWWVDDEETDETGGTYTIENLDADVLVEVAFEEVDPDLFTVTFKEENGLVNVSIQVYSDENRTVPVGDPVITDEEGEATKDLPDGDYWFTAALAGYQDYPGDFEVDGEDKTVEFLMVEPGPLEIVSIDAIIDTVEVDWGTSLADAIAKLHNETEYRGVVANPGNVLLAIINWTSETYAPHLEDDHIFTGQATAPEGFVFAEGVNTTVNATVTVGEEPVSAVITGTIADETANGEANIVAGGSTINITLGGGETWVAAVGTNHASTYQLLDGITGDGGATGWLAVRDVTTHNHVERINDTFVSITLPAVPLYAITDNETVTVEVPHQALVNTSAGTITGTPTLTIVAHAASAVITGTIEDETKNAEPDIVAGGSTINITLGGGETWVADVGGNNANTAALLDGITGDGGATGWEAVRAVTTHNHVERINDTFVSITLPPVPLYAIIDNETVTVEVPHQALVHTTAGTLTATPTLTIVAESTIVDGRADDLDNNEPFGRQDFFFKVKGDLADLAFVEIRIPDTYGIVYDNQPTGYTVTGADMPVVGVNRTGDQLTIHLRADQNIDSGTEIRVRALVVDTTGVSNVRVPVEIMRMDTEKSDTFTFDVGDPVVYITPKDAHIDEPVRARFPDLKNGDVLEIRVAAWEGKLPNNGAFEINITEFKTFGETVNGSLAIEHHDVNNVNVRINDTTQLLQHDNIPNDTTYDYDMKKGTYPYISIEGTTTSANAWIQVIFNGTVTNIDGAAPHDLTFKIHKADLRQDGERIDIWAGLNGRVTETFVRVWQPA